MPSDYVIIQGDSLDALSELARHHGKCASILLGCDCVFPNQGSLTRLPFSTLRLVGVLESSPANGKWFRLVQDETQYSSGSGFATLIHGETWLLTVEQGSRGRDYKHGVLEPAVNPGEPAGVATLSLRIQIPPDVLHVKVWEQRPEGW